MTKKISKKDMLVFSQVLMGGATISVLLAGIGYVGDDIWLASTQWLFVAAIFALFVLCHIPEAEKSAEVKIFGDY